MPLGRVKWYSLEKGFGFIESEEGADVYLASSALPAGVATVKPGTKLEHYEDLFPELDMILIMTVEPGFGGQSFMADQLGKIKRARELVKNLGLDIWIQVDGGVALSTIEQCADAGADTFVAGSAVYNTADPVEAIANLRAKAQGATDASWWCGN